MKRIVMLLILLGCLAGCGEAVESAIQAQPSPSPEVWGVSAEPSPSQSVAPTPTSTPTPTPTPTPEPVSLRELVPDTVKVWVDGQALDGRLSSGTTMVSAQELEELWPWLQGTGEGAAWTLTDPDGQAVSLTCKTPEDHAEGEGIHFSGQTEEYWLPIRWVCDQTGAELLWDAEEQEVYVSSAFRMDTEEIEGTRLSVLMYHAVSDDLWGIEELFVSPEDMRSQLEYLAENGYDTIFFSDLDHLSDYDKPILLTFDDGYDDNYTELFPLLQEFQAKATVFTISDLWGQEHYLTKEQAKEMADSGLVDIQSHTVSHDELDTLSAEEQAYQFSQSQLDIARVTKRLPYVLAYPSGRYDSDTLELMPQYYRFGLLMNGGDWYVGDNDYEVPRIYISRYDSMDTYAYKTS